MPTLNDVLAGTQAQAVQVQQIIDALKGTPNKGVPVALVSLNDPNNYALTVQNDDPTNSRALSVLKADGTTLISADATGVTLGSPVNLQAGSLPGAGLAAGSVGNAALGPDVARANMLVNGGLEVWQRGAGPYTASLAYTADRWFILLGTSSTLSVSRDSTNMDTGSQYCGALTYVHSAESFYMQVLEGLQQQANGRPITFSVRVRTATANAARLFVDGAASRTYSSYHTGSGAYQTLSVTVTPTGSLGVQMGLSLMASSTVYVDNATLVVGSQAANYVPLSPADELARCLRYYEVLGDPGGGDLLLGAIATAGAQIIRGTFPYKANKPVAPTVTKVGTWGLTNAGGQPTLITGSKTNTAWYLGSTAAGEYFTSNSTAGNCLTVESNP